MNRLQRTTYCRLTSLLALLLALCLAALPVRAAESSKLPLTMRLPVNVTFDQDGLDPKRSYVLSLVPENRSGGQQVAEHGVRGKRNRVFPCDHL